MRAPPQGLPCPAPLQPPLMEFRFCCSQQALPLKPPIPPHEQALQDPPPYVCALSLCVCHYANLCNHQPQAESHIARFGSSLPCPDRNRFCGKRKIHCLFCNLSLAPI